MAYRSSPTWYLHPRNPLLLFLCGCGIGFLIVYLFMAYHDSSGNLIGSLCKLQETQCELLCNRTERIVEKLINTEAPRSNEETPRRNVDAEVKTVHGKEDAVSTPASRSFTVGLISAGGKFDAKKPVPRIVHFAWYSKSKKLSIRFHHYMSILAALKFIRPKKIMFWYERAPEGDLWHEIRSIMQKKTKLIMKQRVGPTSIFGRPIDVDEHKSDIIRLEALIKYGGIYMDLDVITLKPLDELRKYDVTLGYEAEGQLCNGFIMAKPYAPFLRLWFSEYATFEDEDWRYHSVTLPGILATNYPDLVHTEWNTINRPNWTKEGLKKIYKIGVKYDWGKNYAMHLWYRKYNKDHNPEDIKTLDSTLGEMFRFVYYGSKDLIK